MANIIANERLVEKEKEKSLLLSVSKDITACRSKNEFLNVINYKLKNLIDAKEVVISVLNDDGETHSTFLHDLTGAPPQAERSTRKYPLVDGIYESVSSSTSAVMLDLEELLTRGSAPSYIDSFYKNGIRQGIAIPLIENNRVIGAIFMYMEKKIATERYPLSLLQGIASQIAIAVSNIRAYEKIQQQLKEIDYYKALLEEENQYLHQQIKTAFDDSSDMIGHAGGLKEVSNLISRVAASDTTVLILGETGTGKELVARALHSASPRKDKLIIKVNCAALPATLIESELFGHEKGSFTGATERRIGKFELANNGTLFLDEIGELALELQVKLLRALQEKEIERIGGKEVIKTNVRIIAATNRNLYQEVEAGRFRSDLYYRLNVFPITIPSLKERVEDIPALVSYFMNKLSGKLGKNIQNIGTDAMSALMAHTWPGNVRELEHVIERSALMAKDSTIREVYMPNNSKSVTPVNPEVVKIKSLDESERDHIKAILMRCNGKIKGAGGAAELLGLPSTTLHSKMKKLGIAKDDY
ncbi:AAA domain-containing protein [Mucilaginibacter sp. R11]|uniref:AAA domain-containing protein n=1 Tax=Mucilaginibacter agri TaxID=2695265 RepID=A0A965ZLB9_9SPHI|nr:AAA domain-containing protein [Mucilaginibacter agri]